MQVSGTYSTQTVPYAIDNTELQEEMKEQLVSRFTKILDPALENLKQKGVVLQKMEATVRNRVDYCFVVYESLGAGRLMASNYTQAVEKARGIAKHVVGVPMFLGLAGLASQYKEEWDNRSITREENLFGSPDFQACCSFLLAQPRNALPNAPFDFFARYKEECPPAMLTLVKILQNPITPPVGTPIVPAASVTPAAVKTNPKRQNLECEIEKLEREEQEKLREVAALSKKIAEMKTQLAKLTP